jgi:hypothetical protein
MKSFEHRIRLLLLLLVGTLVGPHLARSSAPWWNANWRFRVPVNVNTGSYPREMKPADVAINFTQLLASVGQSGTFSEASVRVVEVDAAGAVVNDTVQFQFDKDVDYQAATKASGTLVILMEGTTPAGSPRQYFVYFDLTGRTFTPPVMTPRVQLTDDVPDEGQLSYRVQTEAATYFYHKQGGGFSSILDVSGNDWIGYHPTYPGSTAGGPSRGLPNPVYPRGYFHPGSTSSSSTLLNSGPLKLTIRTRTVADDWECKWEIYPRYARLTMVSGDSTFWLLYEGTPGGMLEPDNDVIVTSNGTPVLTSQTWIADIAGDEWAYFGDPALNRSLFMAHHENDEIVDSYRPMDGLMTVFGFGRQSINSYLATFPTQLTVGLFDAVDAATASAAINSAYKDLAITTGPAEVNTLPGLPIQLLPPDRSTNLSQQVEFRWTSSPLSILYGLQVATDSTLASGLVVNDSTVVDTSHIISGLASSRTYYWRVFGRNASGKGPFSNIWRFTTAGTVPAAVLLISPDDMAAVISDSVRFTWEAAQPGADRYWFELGYDEAFVFRLHDSSLTDTSAVARNLVKNHTYFWRVRAHNGLGWGPFSEVHRVQTTLTGVRDDETTANEFELLQNYPNPFNPETTIEYRIAGAAGPGGGDSHVTLTVYDLVGREVERLADERQAPGTYSVRFAPSNLAGGVYLYRLQVRPLNGNQHGSFSAVRALVLLK